MTATAVMTTLRMSISLKGSPPVAICGDIDPVQSEPFAVSLSNNKKLIADSFPPTDSMTPQATLLRLDRVAFLQGVEPGVQAARRYQVFVGAGLGDVALFEHEDGVHAFYQP